MNKTRTVVLSLDALGREDQAIYEKMPAIAGILENGAHIPAVRSVMPTLTYPAHTTLVTGRNPSSHGIVNNVKIQPGKNEPDWFWHAKDIQGDTLFKAAKRAGNRTGALLWPVHAGAPLNWNIAEIWPHRAWQTQATVTLANSTKRFALAMARKHGSLLQGIAQPHLDRFTHACALEIINKQDFDLLFVHYTDIDRHKHVHGTRGREVEAAIRRADTHVGEVLFALDQRGLLPDTNVIVLSDHSHRDITKALRVNQVFYRHALLSAKAGRITRWRAFANSCEGSCYIYLNEKEKEPQLKEFIHELLHDIRRIHGGIDRILTNEEAVAAGGDPDCAFLLTAQPGVVFSNSLEGDIFGAMDNDYRANHGYPPDLPNYEAMFAATGPAFTRTTVQRTVPMIDIAPTIAAAAQLDLRDAEGIPVHEILK